MARTAMNVMVGVDIGSSGIAVIMLDVGWGAKQALLGNGYNHSLGIQKGIIAQLEDAVSSIKMAVSKAEQASGVNADNVWVSVDMPGMILRKGECRLPLKAGRKLQPNDLNLVRRDLYHSMAQTDYTLIQLTDLRYDLDGEYLVQPIGCKGSVLTVKGTAIIAPTEPVERLQHCLERAGLKSAQLVAGPLALAEAVLSGAERELGVICVDIGASLTRIIYINRNSPEDMAIFPAGAEHIISDLAVGLHISLETAKSIVEKHGLDHQEGHLDIQRLSGTDVLKVPYDLIHRIIRYRVEEILDFVDAFIDGLQIHSYPPGGIVLSGGCAKLPGLPLLAQTRLDIPVRVGLPRLVSSTIPDDEIHQYSSAIGLALWGIRQADATEVEKRYTERGILKRFKNWL